MPHISFGYGDVEALFKVAAAINVNQRPREFQAYRWIFPDEFDLDWVPNFKREVYRQVIRDFFGIKL